MESIRVLLSSSCVVPFEVAKWPSKLAQTRNPSCWVAEGEMKKKKKKRFGGLKCRRSEYFDQQEQQGFSRVSGENYFGQQQQSVGGFPPKVFVGHSVYKGKAALTVEPKAPEFAPLDSGAFKVSRDGYVLLQFAPGVGTRQYDWSRKQVFSLSVTEIGTLIGLGAKDSCEFFHDPFKGKSVCYCMTIVKKASSSCPTLWVGIHLRIQLGLTTPDVSTTIPVEGLNWNGAGSIFVQDRWQKEITIATSSSNQETIIRIRIAPSAPRKPSDKFWQLEKLSRRDFDLRSVYMEETDMVTCKTKFWLSIVTQ
ncbi:hypothetical protein Syun_023752 [Stephania yunnanensis]|uniref:Uncharacterized protein n=1 Tax=Stephania yunnanensis TaxID=152371 RepID=A0AAP0FAB4_9MAGN